MANWSNEYLNAPYVDGGRDLSGFDCWGLVRDVLHRRFNLPLLASFGNIHPDDKQALTDSYKRVVTGFVEGPARARSVAAGFRRGNLIHVGICFDDNGILKILHTSRRHGPSVIRARDFKRLFEEVKFYDYCDPDLPE